MQTKKRAKAVKFGLKKEKEAHKEEPEKKVSKKSEEVEKIPPEQVSAPIENPAPEADVQETPEESDLAKMELDEAEDKGEESDKTEDKEVEREQASEDKSTLDEESDGTKEEDAEVARKNKSESKSTPEQEEKETLLDKDATFFNVPPDGYNDKKSMFPYFLKVMFITFLLGLTFFAGIFYAVKNKEFKLPELKLPAIFNKTPETTPSPTEAPTPKPVDLSKYNIEVLNGSTTAGEAAKLRTILTDKGFKVASVGNAAKRDFLKTEITTSEDVDQEYIEKLKEALSESYELGSVSTDATGSADVVITIGSSFTN